MRVNVYAEEMTDRIEIISKTIEGREFTGCRFYLELPVTKYILESDGGPVAETVQMKGPFMHGPDDDDSAAVTFWGKQDLRPILASALELLDDHYDDDGSGHITRVNLTFQTAGPETARVVLEVAMERSRQVKAEGWSPDHDDDHQAGELARAAACYALDSIEDPRPVFCGKPCRGLAKGGDIWPFDFTWWKPGEPRRNLVKAAALIVAEIERIDRAEVDLSGTFREVRQRIEPDPEKWPVLPVPHRER